MDFRLPISPTRGSQRRACRGFTMVEILTVIGILAILAGIVTIAFNVIGGNTATRQTRVALESLKSMTTEYSATTTTKGAPWDTGWNSSTGTGYAVTGRVMQRLMKMPKNAEIFGKLEAKLISTMPWSSDSAVYTTGDLVEGYEYIGASQSTSNTTSNTTANTSLWQPSTAKTYALKDGWGKQILYCGSSLTNVTSGGSSRPDVKSPDGRPFWVSAGPDGDFATHDDNVYSFEN